MFDSKQVDRVLIPLCAAVWTLAVGAFSHANAAVVVRNLQVEYRDSPIGIDTAQPRFSWQMAATAGERGVVQSAYELQVRDSTGALIWDSKKSGSAALGIPYAGDPLEPATRYTWTVNVWREDGAKLTASSWFETGLMNPSPTWPGSEWIGGNDDDLVLYAPYLEIFDVQYTVAIAPGSSRASFIYGANDSRLMDRNKNIYQLENSVNQSYIKIELDIAGLDGSASGNSNARLNVYRAGYKPTDSAKIPFRVFEIPNDVINGANKNAEHVIGFSSIFGQIAITVDGNASLVPIGAEEQPAGLAARFGPRRTNVVNLNPMGLGGDYLPFGMLCDMGFAVEPGQNAWFRDVAVVNHRRPRNTLFREDLSAATYNGIYADRVRTGSGFSVRDGRYSLLGGANGVFVVKDPSRNSAPMLRAAFTASGKPIAAARLYVTARGVYEFYINGERVGEDYYTPGLTQYNVTHMYQTYDVTRMIKAGKNAMGAMLGEGWWSGLLSFGSDWNYFGDRQSLLAKLVITYTDGSGDTFGTTPETWKYFGRGPIMYSSLDLGEVYDASKESAIRGWSTAHYDDRAWKAAVVVSLEGTAFSGKEEGFMAPPKPVAFDHVSLIGEIGANARTYRILTAKSVKEVRRGVYVYDLQQNVVGVPRITIANGQAGQKITLRFSEMLYPNLSESGENAGMIMTENYRAALSQDVYVMRAGRQVFQPHFTSHGFQYIEVTGIDKALPLEAVQAVVISSVRKVTADYKTSDEKVNKLWSNLVWSNIDNFVSVPTDCPQRNERMGWSGDINVFSRTATYLSNADQFLTRHMYAMRDVQAPSGRFTDVAPVGPGFGGILWGSAGIVVPWEVYQQYRDVGILKQNYAAMSAYMEYIETTIDPKSGVSSDSLLGDWLGPQNNVLGPDFLGTAYYAYDLGIMAKVAKLLGKTDDAAKYNSRYQNRKSFFNQKFVNQDRKTLGISRAPFSQPSSDKPPQFHVADTQTSYAVGLGMGLFSDENRPYMVKNLAEAITRDNHDDGGAERPPYSLMTGFIGTAWISDALSENGRTDLAYRLLLNEEYPSWLYAVDQGATTIWERLNGYTVETGFGGNNSMNSFNHYSFGAVGQWMIGYSLGIQRDEPGFQKFILQPEPDPNRRITWAQGYYDSMYGRIVSAWTWNGNELTYRATVPANSTATLYLPSSSGEGITESGKDSKAATGVQFLRYADGKAVFRLASGSYDFTAPQ